MIIKMHTISSAHAASAIGYGLSKKVVQKVIVDGEEKKVVIKPIFVNARNLDVNPLTGEPTSAIDVYHQMRLQEAASTHKTDEPIFRLELRPPVEECRNWTAAQWEQFDRDCEEALQSVDKVPVRNKKTGKMEMKSVRPLDLTNAQVLTTRHVDTDPHLHKLINRHTLDGKMLSAHYCELVGIVAANKIAEKYGWTRADKRQNQRKERINTDAVEVLKGMKKFDIEAFFLGMRLKGWTVDPKYDKNGNAVRYRIGETPKGSDRPVMYGASELGHARKLMASKLFDTWKELHPEARQQSKPSAQQTIKPKPVVMPKSVAKTNDELYRLQKQREKEAREREAREQAQKKPTQAQIERQDAIESGHKAIREFVKSTSWTRHFSIHDIEDVLPAAIAAKAINMSSTPDGWRVPGELENAARDLVGMFEVDASMAAEVTSGILGAIADMALPPTTPSLGGGGNNDLPKKKDDDWNWWKKKGFTNKQRRGMKR